MPLRRAVPYENIAQKPAFPVGEAALRAAIQHRVRYPRAAQGQEAPVDLAVECIVEPNGPLTVLHTSEVPTACEGLGYEQEAVRVVRTLPPFVPGRRAGQPVAATDTVPVAFRQAARHHKQ
ncbi:energy transducer TonB [Hymenobacter terricola]|uniref:energy transducer TonB n=1 Tax=Hymenobacter terricola TaxID=2819236 RepID=UPI001CF10EEB|nr:energy transducer TonB [Hymenobacter terricola]